MRYIYKVPAHDGWYWAWGKTDADTDWRIITGLDGWS